MSAPTLKEDLDLIFGAAMSYGMEMPVGWTPEQSRLRLKAAVEAMAELVEAYDARVEADGKDPIIEHYATARLTFAMDHLKELVVPGYVADPNHSF